VPSTDLWLAAPGARSWTCPPAPSAPAAFHAGLPGYAPTPLHDLPALAAECGVRRVLVKDEAARFGLPAFKALGVSYAIHRVLGERTVGPAPELVAATDGNHGWAVAAFARRLGLPALIVVPRGADPRAVAAIRAEQAAVTVLDGDYDAAVRRAATEADSRPAAVLVQDTAWPGYTRIPQWIVDGYSTMFVEIDTQLAALGEPDPALVVTPMGVGSLAQAVVTHHRGTHHPGRGTGTALLGVEADTAACVLASLVAGRPCTVPTGATAMHGLNCGTPSALAWPYLRDGLDAVVAVSDGWSADAGRDLAALGVPAGPCGAASLAALRSLPDDARARLGLGARSTVVLLSTEAAR
jgi:diaminopropionate ammonia-lyase